jgi:hypothetical protein
MPISALALFDRLVQAWVGHPVKDVPHRLRVILSQNVQNLPIKQRQPIVRATIAF